MGSAEENAKEKDVPAAFDRAIDAAFNNKRIQYLALACELAGDHLVRIDEDNLAAAYFAHARECYCKWGAAAKASQLERRRAPYFDEKVKRTSRVPSLENVSGFLETYKDLFDYSRLSTVIDADLGVSDINHEKSLSSLGASYSRVEELSNFTSLK